MTDLRETRDCGGDPAAYVLGALEPDEAAAFEAHMRTCVVCRDEVQAFRGTADALALAVPQYEAPKALRRRVMRAVRDEPSPQQARRRRAPALAWLGLRPAWAGVAAVATVAAVAALTLGLTLGSSGGARTLQASVIGVPGSAQVRVANGRAELIVAHMPPPPAGKIYEVWLKRGSAAPAPTRTLFSVTRAGRADVGVAGRLSGVTEVLVSPEPAGGSLSPTHTPVIVARLD
jgi:anti-sigma-K factor RskA